MEEEANVQQRSRAAVQHITDQKMANPPKALKSVILSKAATLAHVLTDSGVVSVANSPNDTAV